jgi:anti-sigma B factor antagonist
MKAVAPVFRPMLKTPRADVLQLEGEIDLYTSTEFAESLRTMIARKPKVVVVDLGKVTFVGSSGLAALIEAARNVQEYGGEFALIGVQERVQHILEIARLDKVFRVFPDLDSATRGLSLSR